MRFMKNGFTLLSTLAILSLGMGACSDDPNDIDDSDVHLGGNDVEDPGPKEPDNKVKVFDFVQDKGDDGKACKGQDRCVIFLSFSEQVPLELIYTEGGEPIKDKTVTYTIEGDADGIGRLNSNSTYTGADGIAKVIVSPKVNVAGIFTVRVSLTNSDLPDKFFDIAISSKGVVPLTVLGQYNGQRQVSNYSVSLYEQTASGAPKCINIDLETDPDVNFDLPTSTIAQNGIALAQTARFVSIPGLEAGPKKYTILVYSKNQQGALQAIGCNDKDGAVTIDSSKTVTVMMEDRKPSYRGSYDIISSVDFTSAIPEPYGTYVRYVVNFFQRPSETLVTIVCDLMPSGSPDADDRNQFCSFLFNSNNNPTAIGQFVFELLDALIDGFAGDSIFGQVLQTGGEVADIITDFKIASTFIFSEQPNEDGIFPEGAINEYWHTVFVTWTQGANCNPVEERGCGNMSFSLDNMAGTAPMAPVQGNVPASIEDEYILHIDEHPLSLNYGAIINLVLEQIVIPAIMGDPNVSSYGDLLGTLIGGDSECLVEDNCCERFIQNAMENAGGASQNALTNACNVILTAAPSFISTSLNGLQLNTGSGFTLGTAEGCMLYDNNNDFVIDAIGKEADPCKWTFTILFKEGGTPVTIDSVFWGKRSE